MSFVGRIGELHETLVDFDTGDNAARDKIVGDGFAIVGKIASGFVEEDDAAQVLLDARSGKEDVAVGVAILESVRDA